MGEPRHKKKKLMIKSPPAPCGSAATKADVKKRRKAILPCPKTPPLLLLHPFEKTPPLLLLLLHPMEKTPPLLLIILSSWPQPTVWKGKPAWKSLHALQAISFHPPSNLTDLLQLHKMLCLFKWHWPGTREPGHWEEFCQTNPRLVICPPLAPSPSNQWLGGLLDHWWNSPGSVGSRSKWPLTWEPDGSLCGTRWNYPPSGGGGHLGWTGATALLWPISSSPGLGRPQPEHQTFNLSKHITGKIAKCKQLMKFLDTFVIWREMWILNYLVNYLSFYNRYQIHGTNISEVNIFLWRLDFT